MSVNLISTNFASDNMETTCSMEGCYNTVENKSLNFHPFPKDFDLCMLWVQNCGRAEFFEDFAYGGAQPFINKVLCSNHFKGTDLIDPNDLNKGLKPRAIPFLQCESSLVMVKTEYEELDDLPDADIDDLETSCNQTDTFIKHEYADNFESNVSTNEFGEAMEQSLHADTLELERDKLLEDTYLPLLVISNNNELFKDTSGRFTQNSQEAFQNAWRMTLESTEQREARNRANALRNAFRRANETEEQRKARNQANALRNASRRANETDDQRKERLYKNAVRAALRRSMESEEEQKERRRKNALRAAYRRSAETEQQRAERRLKDKLRSAERRKKESDLQSKLRRYNDAVRAAFRRSNETEEQRHQRRMYDVMRAAQRRTNESEDQRMKRLQTDRERAARRRLLKKFQQNMAIVQNTFVDHDLGPCMEYDVSCNSTKTDSSYEQCLSDSFDGNFSNDELSNHSHCESESLGNTTLSEFDKIADNVGIMYHRPKENSNFSSISNDISSDNISRNEIKPHEKQVDVSKIPEVVWCS